MSISLVVGGIATVPAAIAYAGYRHLPTPALICLGHIAAVGFVVAIATTPPLARRTTGLLGKDPGSGRINIFGAALFWSFHLGLRMKRFYRDHIKRNTEPPYHEIIPGWFLGRWPYDPTELPRQDAAVIDVTCELPRTHQNDYLCLPTWDTHAPTAEQIATGVSWALDMDSRQRPLYFHCAHGHGRSVAVICAALLQKGRCKTLEDAEKLVKAARPKIKLNAIQKNAVRQWIKLQEKAK